MNQEIPGVAFVFGPDIPSNDHGEGPADDAAGPTLEQGSAKKWPLEESMYIKVFKEPTTDAIVTILESERFLLCEGEINYIRGLQTMPIEALYILIRLALRKDGWHRKSDYGRYAADMDQEQKLEGAIRILCTRNKTSSTKTQNRAVEGDRDAPIDLTCDSDIEDDVPPAEVIRTEAEPPTKPILLQEADLDLSYHALSHDDATPQELLEMLSLEELNKLARDYNVRTSNKKRKEVIDGIIRSANSQLTLAFVAPSKPSQQPNVNLKAKSRLRNRLKELCLKALVHCVKLNPSVLLLIRRINLLFFRTTTHEAQLFIPAILVACKKRTYSIYNPSRTNRVFESREALLRYEEALQLEAAAESILEQLRVTKKSQGTKAWPDLETKLMELYNMVIQGYNASLAEQRGDQRHGLERFEAGYVYARTLYHIAFTMGKINGVDEEVQILQNLLNQKRWLRGNRGGYYDRIACIYMKDLKNWNNAARAHEIVTLALTDDETRFQYRPKLVRRLARLEKVLEMPISERHTCTGKISKCDEIYIMGERRDTVDPEEPDKSVKTLRGYILASSPDKAAKPKRRYIGKTLWEGEDGSLISVEEFALEHYARQGFKGKHCEGRLTRFLFALLFHDILFHPSVPGAFETAYQTAPLDLIHDTFYSSRKELIDERLEELLLPGRALEIVALRDEQLRKDNIFLVGGRWDAFEREEIMEIVEYMPEQVIHDICLVQAQDFEASGGGVPDLILWSVEREEIKFVEVKSTNDKLSETQKLWIHHLINAGAAVEVCHVQTAADCMKREDAKKRTLERAKSRTRSQSAASSGSRSRRGGRKSMFEEDSEEEHDGGEMETSDWEALVVEELKAEEGEEVKPYVLRGRKRGCRVKEEEEKSDVGGMRKRAKTR